MLSYPLHWEMVQSLASELLIVKEIGERRAKAIIRDAKRQWVASIDASLPPIRDTHDGKLGPATEGLP